MQFSRVHYNLMLSSVLSLWLIAISAGTYSFWSYAAQPGEAGAPPSDWPADARIKLHALRPTLLLFLHPHCPCSLATLTELEILLIEVGQRVDAHVLFIKPPTAPVGWEKGRLWTTASRIRGVTLHVDDESQEAQRFSALTSGIVLVYDPTGNRIFRGGITRARGEIGENSGSIALKTLLEHTSTSISPIPIFGCPLTTPNTYRKGNNP